MQFYLNAEERRVLVSELLVTVIDFDVPTVLKVLLHHLELQGKFPAGALSNEVFVEKAVDICCASGYEIHPPALVKFLDYLVENGRMEADGLLRVRLMTPPRGITMRHPLEAELLWGRLVFANRSHLRQLLRELVGAESFKKILHINGAKGSGRSWTSQLIEFYCAKTEGHLHCAGSVTVDNGAATGPLELAKDLVTKLGPLSPSWAAPPPMASNEDAYIIDLAQWVISIANEGQPHLNNNRRRVWFLFDGFATGVVRDDTAKFLVELARLCTGGVAAQLHRIVFCEFDFDVASRIKLKVENYNIEPLTSDDIRQIIHSVISADTNIPPTERDMVSDEALQLVIGDMAGPFVDLSEIGARLQDVIEESLA